jgi:hypothetical protein
MPGIRRLAHLVLITGVLWELYWQFLLLPAFFETVLRLIRNIDKLNQIPSFVWPRIIYALAAYGLGLLKIISIWSFWYLNRKYMLIYNVLAFAFVILVSIPPPGSGKHFGITWIGTFLILHFLLASLVLFRSCKKTNLPAG